MGPYPWRDLVSLRLPISKLKLAAHVPGTFSLAHRLAHHRTSIMSTASKITLASTIVGTVSIVAFVHWAQTAEKAVSSI